MSSNVFKATPPLKVCEFYNRKDEWYLYLEEEVGISEIDQYSIRLEFMNAKKYDEVQEIKDYLKEKGLTFVFQKNQ
ncbi:hypothetical protein [Pontiella agarivorans]|uniref:Uncharacterized protein n=1 Tax=Pontiella agarivorans TaxID=3038953 RepID=A0ABU5MW90_9BACT|nr:hypothetical protein [Pontiella agarivorans]MDZ8118491.1 hypothetical protein [Pontiella agarivorans]